MRLQKGSEIFFVDRTEIDMEDFEITFFLQKFKQKLKDSYKFLIENPIIINSLKIHKLSKKMISQTNEATTQKHQQNDFTNVSTSNSCQHSIDSSFQEKSASQNSPNLRGIEEDSSIDCECVNMEDQSKNDEKKSKQRYFKKSLEWLGRKYKRFKVLTQTLYLAISYLIKYIGLNGQRKLNYELLSAICLLLAAKINEIHFPSIKSIMGAIDFHVTKRQILQAEQEILEELSFEMNLQHNSYSTVHEYFIDETEEKRKNAERLLFLALSNSQTLEFGESFLGLSIVYLLKPEALKQNASINRDKMKKIAFIVYNMYKEKKNQLSNKENSEC